MSDEEALRRQARHAMHTGALPRSRPDRMWGGPGNGASCAVCGDTVTPDDTAFELEFGRSPEQRHANPYHFHIRCFAAWELERDLGDAQSSTSGDQGSGPAAHATRVLHTATGDATIGDREHDPLESPGGTK